MNTLLLVLLQCGAFLLIPVGTFLIGVWLITRSAGTTSRLSEVLIAVLVGVVFFEAATIGMLIDPRGGWAQLFDIIKISAVVGVIAALSVLVFTPVFRALIRTFR